MSGKRSLTGSLEIELGIAYIMANTWSLGPLTLTSFGLAMLLGTASAGAQAVCVPVASGVSSPYAPVSVAMEPSGCPLNGSGQWAFINNGWVWCPPTTGNGASAGYGYSAPVSYGYSAPAAYGYTAPAAYGYSAPVSYGYSAPVAYGYGAPVAYGTGTSLTGSPLLDAVLGVAATSLIASQFQPSYQQAYYPGYAPYGYPTYGQSYPVGYQAYPPYGSGNTYVRNVYRNGELAAIARDQRRVAFLRAEGANHAQIAALQRRIQLNERRIAWQRATAVPRYHFVSAHAYAARMTAVRMDSPRMAPRVVAPRMVAPRMAPRMVGPRMAPRAAGGGAGPHSRR